MKQKAMIAALLIGVGTAHSTSQSPAQPTQTRDVWTDPSTGLTWAEKDNGKDVRWKGAVSYCRKLRLGGQTDWRLPTLDELKSIYDQNAHAPGLTGPGRGIPGDWQVKGNIYLTGHQWSANRRLGLRGKPDGYDWWFSFNDGKENLDPSSFPYSYHFMRALCVRGTQTVRTDEVPTLHSIPEARGDAAPQPGFS